ncbi:MAG: PQQ-dependent sugar dehydrogenase [Planctomycetota bacterium]
MSLIFRLLALALVATSLHGQVLVTQQAAGFVEDRITGTVFQRPVALEFLPDGRLLVLEHRLGEVWQWDRGTLRRVGALENVVGAFEDGLLGVALDPAFPARPFLYLYWTHRDPATALRTNRVSRVELTGDLTGRDGGALAFGGRLDLLTGLPAQGDFHNGGCLRFGPGGDLFVATGDNGQPLAAQDPTSPLGKILRLRVVGLPANATGTASLFSLLTPGPPLFTGLGYAPFCFAIGLRNPFRFTVDPASGRLVIVDVGETTAEEIDLAQGGENFGWPYFEANFSTGVPGAIVAGSLTGPVADGLHGPPLGFTAAILLGGVYHAPAGAIHAFPSSYENDLFVADLGFPGSLYRAELDPAGSLAWAPPAAGQVSAFAWGEAVFATDGRIGPDGALWYCAHIPGEIRRIRPRGSLSLTVTGGGGQVGNAGHHAAKPLEVMVVDHTGAPRAGAPVHFAVARGGGRCSPPDAVTDAAGLARCTYWFGVEEPEAEPRVTAWLAEAEPRHFDLVWRGAGLEVRSEGPVSKFTVTVKHSVGPAPLTLAAEALVSQPFFASGAGAIWTSAFAPGSGLVVLGDGLGLVGPPDASFVIDATGRFRETFVTPVGVAGDFILQAYAFDLTRQGAEAVMVSNPLPLSLR